MIRMPTLVLGATLGLAALGVSSAASAGVHFGVGIGLPIVVAPPAVVAAPVVPAPSAVVAPPVVPPYPPAVYYNPYYNPYYGPYYGSYYGPGFYGYPRVVLGGHFGYVHGGHGWHR